MSLNFIRDNIVSLSESSSKLVLLKTFNAYDKKPYFKNVNTTRGGDKTRTKDMEDVSLVADIFSKQTKLVAL